MVLSILDALSKGPTPIFLCATIVLLAGVGSLAVIVRKEQSGVARYVLREDLWKPCCRNIHPGWIFAFRAIVFLYLFALSLMDCALHGLSVFEFYTQWTFLLLTIYFGMASIVSAKAIIGRKAEIKISQTPPLNDVTYQMPMKSNEEESGTVEDEPLLNMYSQTIDVDDNSLAALPGYLMQIIFQVVAPAAILTDIVFWSVLFPLLHIRNFYSAFLDINMHAVNLVFVLLETFLNNLSFPWFRGAYFVLWSFLYISLQWTFHAFGQKWWPYPFLDPTKPEAPLWYLALALSHVFCFALMCFISFVKRCCLRCPSAI